MDKSSKNALVIWAATIAGGAGGSWATTKLGARFGLSLGPWGVVAGALIGAVAGAALSKRVLGEVEHEALPDVERDML